MRRTTLLALAAALLAPTSASAGPPDVRLAGNCSARGLRAATPGDWIWEVEGRFVAWSATYGHNPLTVTSARCEFRVDGVLVGTAHGVGAGPVAAVPATTFQHHDPFFTYIEVCGHLAGTDAHGDPWTAVRCDDNSPKTLEMPPQSVADLIEDAFDTVDGHLVLVCPSLAGAGPLSAGPVEIADDGDVVVDGETWADCP